MSKITASNKLSIVFMGTSGFAVPSLKALLDAGYRIPAVVTATDKPTGRGRSLQVSPVKEFAIANQIRPLQPDSLKDEAFVAELRDMKADLQVVVAFRMLPEIVWSMPPLGTFNLHASLLPQYRGAAPINHVIINGEKKTGVTTFFIDHQIDTGKIILQEPIDINDSDNAGALHDKLMVLGADTVLKTVRLIESGNFTEIPQDQLIKSGEVLIPAPKIFKEDCRIQWQKKGADIVHFIRGLSPYPAAYSMLTNNEGEEILMKIYEAGYSLESVHENPGTIISDNKSFLRVAVPDGYVSIYSLQIQGKNRLNVKSFLAGFRNITSYQAF